MISLVSLTNMDISLSTMDAYTSSVLLQEVIENSLSLPVWLEYRLPQLFLEYLHPLVLDKVEEHPYHVTVTTFVAHP